MSENDNKKGIVVIDIISGKTFKATSARKTKGGEDNKNLQG